jgi:protein TonB
MKKLLLFIGCMFCFAFAGFSQKAGNDFANAVYEDVEFEASFPGGQPAWAKYLQDSLNAYVPVDNKAPYGTYRVEVKFIVSRDGSVSDVTALTHCGYGMEREVIRVIKNGPKWLPAFQDGRIVNAYRVQPVIFQVER